MYNLMYWLDSRRSILGWYVSKWQKFAMIFFLGPHPTESGGTKVGLPIDNKRTRLNSKEPEAWDAVLYKVGGYTTILEVQIGSKAPVGIWTCRVETAYRRSPQQASLFQWTGPVYVIFNPFDRGKFYKIKKLNFSINIYILNQF